MNRSAIFMFLQNGSFLTALKIANHLNMHKIENLKLFIIFIQSMILNKISGTLLEENVLVYKKNMKVISTPKKDLELVTFWFNCRKTTEQQKQSFDS